MQNSFFTKAEFLTFIARQIQDDEIVVISDVIKEINYTKKLGHAVKFLYLAGDSFQPLGDARVLMAAKNISTCIIKPEHLTKEIITLLEKGKGVCGYTFSNPV